MRNQRSARLALTSFQKELWLSHISLPEKHPGICFCNKYILNDCPDEATLFKALSILQEKYPLLSGTLRQVNGEFPELETRVHSEPDFIVIDFRDKSDPEKEAEEWSSKFKEQPFSPVGGKLCRYALIYINDNLSWFIGHFFHIVGDGLFGVAQFYLLMDIYKKLRSGLAIELDPPPLWEEEIEKDRKHLSSVRAENDIAAWQAYLKKLPEERLFTPKPGRPDSIETIKSLHADLSLSVSNRIRSLASEFDSNISQIFIAFHLIILSRLYDCDSLSVQIPLRFGEWRDLKKVQGHKVQFAPLIIRLQKESTFETLLKDVKEQLKAIATLARTPFQLALRKLPQSRGVSHIWDTNINYIPFMGTKENEKNFWVKSPLPSKYEPVLLAVYIVEQPSGMGFALNLIYSINHFNHSDAKNYTKRFEQVLNEVSREPEISLFKKGALLLSEQNRLDSWEKGALSKRFTGTIFEFFDHIASLHGKETAVKGLNGESQSYDELKRRSNAIAGWLTRIGVKQGQVVAVLAPRHPALSETILGIMKAGGVYLPVDPDYPEERIQHMLEDSKSGIVLRLEDETISLNNANAEIPSTQIPKKLPDAAPSIKTNNKAPAYLIYTSGSTGKSKGVLVAHCSFINMIEEQIATFKIKPGERVLQFASPSFDASLSEIFMALLGGGCLYPVSRSLLDEPLELKDYMARHRITVVTFPPSYLRLFQGDTFPGLRVLITAGEPPVAEDARHYAAYLDYFNAYGPTEASVCATMVRVNPSAKGPITIGKPIPNTRTYILDTKGRQVCVGIPGELCLAGEGLAIGYLNRPELNRKSFIYPAFAPDERVYRTGDTAAWTEQGEILLMGRKDDQVKVRGYRIETGEITSVIEQHPQVSQAVTLDIPGQDEASNLHTFIVASSQENFPVNELVTWLRSHLPDYMIPSGFHLVKVLPVSPSGKVDKHALRQFAKDEKVNTDNGNENEIEKTGSTLEKEIHAIFEEVLDSKVTGPNIDFFILGGDSLKAIELSGQLYKRYHCKVPMRKLLKEATVNSVAKTVLEMCRESAQESDTLPIQELSLNQGQLQLRMQDLITGPSPQYNMPFTLGIDAGKTRIKQFTKALKQAIENQPSCRSFIAGKIDMPHLQLASSSAFQLQEIDLRDSPEPEAAAQQIIDENIHRPFDLTVLPLIRGVLLRIKDQQWQLLLVMHHIIGDGESIKVLLNHCLGILNGKKPPLIQSKDLEAFAKAEKIYLDSREHHRDLAFWKDALYPLPERLDLFSHKKRPQIKKGEGDLIRLPLSVAAADNLHALSEQTNTSLLGSFLGLLMVFLQTHTKQKDIAISVPVGLRDTPDLMETVGYFVNTIVLRSQEKLPAPIIDAIKKTWKSFRQAIEHSRFPFHLLAEKLNVKRDSTRAPIVDVLATHIDESVLIPENDSVKGMSFTPLKIKLRTSKLDYSFILYTRGKDKIELILEYDTNLASIDQANSLLKAFADYIENRVMDPAENRVIAIDPGCNDPVSLSWVSLAWQKILGEKKPNNESNFFVSGGDSIKAIQMVGYLRSHGVLTLTPAHIFEFPTLGELKLKAAEKEPVTDKADYRSPEPGELVDLLPIQDWLFKNQDNQWTGFHMILPLKLDERVDLKRIQPGLSKLAHRHEAFQMAFSGADNSIMLKKPAEPVWESFRCEESLGIESAVQRGVDKLFQSLNPFKGRLFGAVLIARGKENILVLGGHHLVLDAVSLDVLYRELSGYCHTGQWQTQTRTPGAATWAYQLASHREDFPDKEEVGQWKRICALPSSPLSAFKKGSIDKVVDRVSKTITMTDQIFESSSNMRRDLLTGLSRSLYENGQKDPLFITMEGHGRENIFPGLDISQAVGWFTTAFPMRLSPRKDLYKTAKEIEECLKWLPHGGLGYSLAAQWKPEGLDYNPWISINYLGQLFYEENNNGFSVFQGLSSPDAIHGLVHEDFSFTTPLDLSIFISPGGNLTVTASYSPHCLEDQWVDSLLAAWESALATLLLQSEPGPPFEWEWLAQKSLCPVDDIESVNPPLLSQEGMLFQHLLDDGTTATYTQQINFRLKGKLDLDSLEKAWLFFLNRHPALRTLYPFDREGQFQCLTLKTTRTLFNQIDLSLLPEALQQKERDKKLLDQRLRPFDLATGPLLQIQVFTFSQTDHEMSLCFHHLLMDGWCIGILLRELFTAYAAFIRKALPELLPAPSLEGYRQFISALDTTCAKAYWTDLLAGYSHKACLPRSSETVDNTASALREIEMHLDRKTTQALQETAGRMSVTLSNLLQSIWGILIGGNNGEYRDVIYGIVSSGRPAGVENIDQMVGMFIQTLPVRISWQKEDSLADLAACVQKQAIERGDFEFYPLAEIQRLSGAEDSLFDHILIFENYPLEGIQENEAPQISAVTGFEQHPYGFGLSVIPGKTIQFRFSYNPALFSESAITRLKQGLKSLLLAVCYNHKITCKDLEIIIRPEPSATNLKGSKAVGLAIPAEFNQTSTPFPRHRSICQLFSETAAKHPKRTALIGPDQGYWTYEKLDHTSNAIAAGLGGDLDGVPIALYMPRKPAAVAVILGILKAGGSYLPLDEKSPPARIRKMLKIASCKKIIVEVDQYPWIEKDDEILLYATLAGSDKTIVHTQPKGGKNPAYIMFTSGSTGEPKGVVIPHQAVLRLVINNNFWDISPEDRILQTGPLGFDASTLEIWGALLNGAATSFINDDDLLSPLLLRKKIAKNRVTIMWLTSSLCNLLADEDPSLFMPLRLLITGGETLSPKHIEQIMTACPELDIVNGYGPTENTTFTTTHRITRADTKKESIPIGKPVSNTRIYILNDREEPVTVGEWGEICAAGDGLAIGYIGRQDLTEKAFVRLPEPVSERIYKTGDIGRWSEDGQIEFKGRKDVQVKVRGYRIELSEIETALLAIPQIKQAAVVAPKERDYRSLVAYVKMDKDKKDKEEDLKKILRTVLPAYMIPDRINYLKDFPITHNGKLDRRELENTALKRTRSNDTTHDLPVDTIEEQVTQIFSKILEIDVHSQDADFFQLGGQSLKAMRLILRLNQLFDVDLKIRDVMTNTTVKALAQIIKGAKSFAPGADIPSLGNQETYFLSRGQERLWFLQRSQPESTVYAVPFPTRIRGSIDRDALEKAFKLLLIRHEALCIRVPQTMGERALSLKIIPPDEPILTYRDFSSLADPALAVANGVDKEIQRPFRFGYDKTLFRAILFREKKESHVLLLNLHHIICDGWSGEIIIRDLNLLYQGVLNNKPAEISPSSISYVDYAAWQRDYLNGPEGEKLRKRWVKRMTPLPDALNLPVDMPRPLERRFKGGGHRFDLSQKQLKGLKTCADDSGTTLFPVLTALVQIFLYRHTGQEDILMGVPVAGREHWQLDNLVGFFVNTLVLRPHLSADISFNTLVQRVKTNFDDAMADQAFPFEALVDSLNLPRDTSRNPLFDVLVSLEEPDWTELGADSALQMTPYPFEHVSSKLDISFYFRKTANGLTVDIEYDTDLFKKDTLSRMGKRFKTLINSVLKDSDQPVQTLAIMPETERDMVLHGFNNTNETIESNLSIDDLFFRQVQNNPTLPALQNNENESLTYEELNSRVDCLVHHLSTQGIVKGSYVGVCFERSFDLIISIFAIIRMGAVYIPFVPELPSERIASMNDDLTGCVVLVDKKHGNIFTKNKMPVIFVEPVKGKSSKKTNVPSDSTAYVLFTSGSTGRPKGVPIEHQSIINRIQWMQSRFPLGEKDVILQKTPVSFDVSVWELFWWSWAGASLAQLPSDAEKDPQAIIDAVEKHAVTVMHFVPSMLRMFLSYLENNRPAVHRLKSLRYVFASGEALTADTIELFNQLLFFSNKTELHNLYGPTEATVDVTWYPCSPPKHLTSVPIGRPVSNTRIYILDPAKQPVPIGVIGEIFISGIQVSKGYINRAELTAACFLTDPFVPASRMYRTGDLGRRLPSGDIEYLGRNDNQIKLRGFRIEIGEVEAALEKLENVAQAVVRLSSLGGMPCLEAFLVCPGDFLHTLESVHNKLGKSLPAYMIPAVFYRLDSIPLNLSGKTDRKALTGERLFCKNSKNENFLKQESSTEKRLSMIWQNIFPEAEKIDSQQNFFDLGGNSLLVIQLHEYLEKEWPGKFTIAELFARTSIYEQANFINSTIPSKEDDTAIDSAAPLSENAVAIIGMALRLADYETPEALWGDLLSGVDNTCPMPDKRREDIYRMLEASGIKPESDKIKDISFLDDISGFDCKRFGMAPGDVTLMDPEQRLFLETAFRALEDAGYGGNCSKGEKIGVFVGSSPSYAFKDAVTRSFPDQAEQSYILNLPSNMASRIGYMKNWNGPATLVDTACSSSLKAIQDACCSILSGESSMAIAGGARVVLTPLKSKQAFAIETSTGKTKPFDEEADGVGGGEGSIAFLLKPLSLAKADNDAIRAVILGGAINLNGKLAGIAAPNPLAQSAVIKLAAKKAGVELDTIDFFEAHGTGTALGDPIEIKGLTDAFAKIGVEKKVPVTSVKGNFGHLDSAAGALGMAKAVLSLEHGIVPHQVHFKNPNPQIDFKNAPVFVNQNNHTLSENSRPWRSGISAFGLSGVNVHMIVQEAPKQSFDPDNGSCHIIPMSASSEKGLRRYAEEILQKVADFPDWPLYAIAATLIAGRDHLAFRIAIPATTTEDFRDKLLARCLLVNPLISHVKPRTEKVQLYGIANQADIKQAETAFLNGAEPFLPKGKPTARVHLPTVPMDRITCWPVFQPKLAEIGKGFLEKGIQTPGGWSYKIPVDSDNFWPLSEHRLANQPALVGMAVISLFAEAFKRAGSPEGIVINGLNWLKPLFRDRVAKDSVAINLQKEENSFRATLFGCDENGHWGDFIEARLVNSTPAPQRTDLKALKHSMYEIENKNKQNAPTDSPLIYVSPRWDCRVKQWRSEDGQQTLALLNLPKAFLSDLQDTDYHPAMLDVATSLALDRQGLIPAGCRKVYLYKPLAPGIFAHVTRLSDKNDARNSILHVDCSLWDAETSELLVEFKDLMFTLVQSVKPRLHTLKWVEQPAVTSNASMPAHQILLLKGNDQLPDQITGQLARKAGEKGIKIIREKIPATDKERKALALKISEDKVSRILYRVPDRETDYWALPGFLKELCATGLRHPIGFFAAGSGGVFVNEKVRNTRMLKPSVDPALTLGVIMSLSQEEPLLQCRYIELDKDLNQADLLAEIEALPPHTISPVLLRSNGKRYAREISRPLLANANEDLCKNNGCIVFTGGLGAMSLTLAEAALSCPGNRVALIHRGDFPNLENTKHASKDQEPVTAFRAKRLQHLKDQGLAIKGFRCDVCSRNDLEETLSRIRKELGPINGIVHTAGIAGDGFLIRKNRSDYEAVLAPKVDGLGHLHDLTLDDPLDFFVLASSRTALVGAPGQTDYAAANAWMDAFAHWRREQGLTALSINWNTWLDVGMAARGAVTIPDGTGLSPTQAICVLKQAIASDETQIVVSMPGESLCIKNKNRAYESKAREIPVQLLSLSDQIMAIFSNVLGYDKPLSPDDDYYALGGDSITGMQVINRINSELKKSMSLADIFTHSQLGEFIQLVLNNDAASAGYDKELKAPAGEKDYPVSREQLAVLRVEALSVSNTGYNLPQFLQIPDTCDIKLLESAFQGLIDRHEILRTRFTDIETESPRMVILSEQSFFLEEKEIKRLDRAAIKSLVKPFQLTTEPLFRACLLKTYDQGLVLFFDIHHSIADARAVDILLNDLSDLLKGKALSKPGFQQKDAAWQQHHSDTSKTDNARNYWLEKFCNPLPRLDLPADYPRPSIHTFRGETAEFEVPETWVPEIRSLAMACTTTSYTIILSLWALLFSRYAATKELVIAVAADSREGENFSSTTGMFASLVPVLLKIDETQTFARLLNHNHRLHAEALRHQAFPLSSLLAELRPPVMPGRTALAEITFSYMNFETSAGNHQEPYFKRLAIPNPSCKADISIFTTDTGGKLSFALEYYRDLFKPERMQAMGEDFLELLRQLLSLKADQPLSRYCFQKEERPSFQDNRKRIEAANGGVKSNQPTAASDDTSKNISGLVLKFFQELFQNNQITKNDSFFDLGGHSLLGLQIINRINKELESEISIRDLFENPTPISLSAIISATTGKSKKIPAAAIAPDALYPLSHAQQRLYVLHHTIGGDTAYNMPFVFDFHKRLDTERFQRALLQLCRRHEILQTAFVEKNAEVWQRVIQEMVLPFEVHPMESNHQKKAMALFRKEAGTAFDLKKSPLFKIIVCHFGNHSSRLLLLMHHIIGDGWSMQIFFKELMAFYTQEELKEIFPLPPLEIQYKDYAVWQQTRTWKEEASYWKKELDKAPGTVQLPFDGAMEPGILPAGVCKKEIPPDLMNRLRNYARKKKVSLASFCLTVFAALLYRLTRQKDMVIGMGVAGREQQETEGLIGFFINILPVRIKMDDDTEMETLLERVHLASMNGLERHDYPFDLLVRELAPDRQNGREALINVMFEYQRFGDLQNINMSRYPENDLDCTLIDLNASANDSDNSGPPARYDLTLFVQDDPDGCTLRAEFDKGVLLKETVETWLGYLELIMTGVAASAKENEK